jgi:hypothetical protein
MALDLVVFACAEANNLTLLEMSTSAHQHAVTAGPTTGGTSSLATSNSINDSAMTSDPAVSSGGDSLAPSSSKSASQSMISGSVPNREGDLASSSSADVGLLSGSAASVVECLPTGDEKPSTWNKNGEVVDYFIARHHALLPFPSVALWNLSHRTVSDNIGMFCMPRFSLRINLNVYVHL